MLGTAYDDVRGHARSGRRCRSAVRPGLIRSPGTSSTVPNRAPFRHRQRYAEREHARRTSAAGVFLSECPGNAPAQETLTASATRGRK